jgi:hypothetical protein
LSLHTELDLPLYTELLDEAACTASGKLVELLGAVDNGIIGLDFVLWDVLGYVSE